MAAQPLAIAGTGMVTAVGLNSPAACAAIRAHLTNPTETQFRDRGGEPIMSYSVPMARPWRGGEKLTLMAARAVDECLAQVPREDWSRLPVLLCTAEQSRPGRPERLDDDLFHAIEQLLEATFAPSSAVIPRGRAAAAVALLHARKLIYEDDAPEVLIVAADSLLAWPLLRTMQEQDRLLTSQNSNGFIPGEAAAAVLLRRPGGDSNPLRVEGLGFAMESAHVDSGEPLRGDGLTHAIAAALADARCAMHDLDFRITDLSGEQYYFKEAALAFNRLLRKRKEDYQLWHPAECVGEVGAASGVVCLAYAAAAAQGKFAPGAGVLLHMGTDDGARAAIVAFGA